MRWLWRMLQGGNLLDQILDLAIELAKHGAKAFFVLGSGGRATGVARKLGKEHRILELLAHAALLEVSPVDDCGAISVLARFTKPSGGILGARAAERLSISAPMHP